MLRAMQGSDLLTQARRSIKKIIISARHSENGAFFSKQRIIKLQGSLPPDIVKPKTMNRFQKGIRQIQEREVHPGG